MSNPTLGQIAYEAYGRVTDFKNFQGNPMPKWDELPDKIREAWEKAALAIQLEMAKRVLDGTKFEIE